MKKLLILISFIFSFAFCFGQAQQPRGGGSLTVVDSNLFTGNSFRVPIFNDTSSANINRPSLDSSGKIIFTRDRNWFWGRQTTPSRKWIPFDNSSNSLTPSCGYPNGTHFVTWDSLLTFDVTAGPYVLCCDGIPRSTIDVTVTLDTNSTDFQRYDLIILDSNGVSVVKGTPATNPATPQTDSCQLILTYVLVNAHDSVPAVISPTNPFIIYDENYSGEAILDTSTNFATIDTADVAFPVHLDHDLKVTDPSSGNAFKFQFPATIDLNDYGALKFYVRKAQAATFTLLMTFWLDSVQQTFPVQVISSNGGANTYATFVVPLVNVRIIGTSQVNQITFAFGAPQTGTFYFDWIQLQMGFPIVNTTVVNGLQSISFLQDTLYRFQVNNPNTTPQVVPILKNEPPYTIFRNESNVSAPNVNGTLDLSKPYFTGLLPVIYLAPDSAGSFLTTDGTSVFWGGAGSDTTFVGNWLVRRVSDESNNDTLYFGYSMPDTALLSFDTYVGLNGHFFNINYQGNTWFNLEPDILQATIAASTSGNEASSSMSLYADSTNLIQFAVDAVWSGHGDGSHFIIDAITNTIQLTTDTVILNSTLSGASTGYVWTLKDPTTGSGYWGVGGGGGVNIYNSNGTVTADRTVDVDGHYLAFNNGNIGINVVPSVLFQVEANGADWISVDTANRNIQLYANNPDNSQQSSVNFSAADGDVNFSFSSRDDNTGASDASITGRGTSGRIEFASDTSFFVSGIIKINTLAGTGSRAVLADASGNLSAPVSDISVKENIHPLSDGLETIMQLNPVSFYFKDGWKNYGEGKQIGFIAQDIKKILPNSTFVTPTTGKMGYNETDIIPILVKAIQEQQKEIEDLKRGMHD